MFLSFLTVFACSPNFGATLLPSSTTPLGAPTEIYGSLRRDPMEGHQPIIRAVWDSDLNRWISNQYTVTRLQSDIGVSVDTNWNADNAPVVRLNMEVNDVPFAPDTSPYVAPPSYVKGIATNYTNFLIRTFDPSVAPPPTFDTTVRTQGYMGSAPVVYLRLVGYNAAGARVLLRRYLSPIAICYLGSPVPVEPVGTGPGRGHVRPRHWRSSFGL